MSAVYLSHYELRLASNLNACFRDFGADLYRTDPPPKRGRCLRHRYTDGARMPIHDTQGRAGDFAVWLPLHNVCTAVEWGHDGVDRGRNVGGPGTILVTPGQFAYIRKAADGPDAQA